VYTWVAGHLPIVYQPYLNRNLQISGQPANLWALKSMAQNELRALEEKNANQYLKSHWEKTRRADGVQSATWRLLT
jgi:hypothetical protein